MVIERRDEGIKEIEEYRFIVIMCYELSDQFECDANRVIEKHLYSEKEIKEKKENCPYYNMWTGKYFETKQEAYKFFLETWGLEEEPTEEDFNNSFAEEADNLYEVYEIKGKEIIYREDLSTYNW